jgi:hypothetical protein
MRASQTRSIFRRRQRLLLVDAKKLSANLDFGAAPGKNGGAPTMRTDAQIFAADRNPAVMARQRSFELPRLRCGSEEEHGEL